MIELTEKQRGEIGDTGHPIRVVDPGTKEEFYLLRADVFERLQAAVGLDVADTYPAIDRTFAAGWSDPKMSDYDDYESHLQ